MSAPTTVRNSSEGKEKSQPTSLELRTEDPDLAAMPVTDGDSQGHKERVVNKYLIYCMCSIGLSGGMFGES